MAKKKNEFSSYPWYQLMDIEASKTERQPFPARPVGRPHSKFKKKSIHARLANDQIKLLDLIIGELDNRFPNRKITRGDLIAFMTIRLYELLESDGQIQLPDKVTSFVELAKYLDFLEKEGKTEKKHETNGYI